MHQVVFADPEIYDVHKILTNQWKGHSQGHQTSSKATGSQASSQTNPEGSTTTDSTESVEHNLLKCKTFSHRRDNFWHQMDIVSDEKFSSKSKTDQLKIIMSDDTPKELVYIIYRYLQHLDQDRKACLDSL